MWKRKRATATKLFIFQRRLFVCACSTAFRNETLKFIVRVNVVFGAENSENIPNRNGGTVSERVRTEQLNNKNEFVSSLNLSDCLACARIHVCMPFCFCVLWTRSQGLIYVQSREKILSAPVEWLCVLKITVISNSKAYECVQTRAKWRWYRHFLESTR